MKIYDENNIEIEAPDLSKGYLTDEQRLVAHHEAVKAVEEVSHYEVIRVYSNGGKDVRRVIDVPAVEAQEAWDEYETVQIFHLYSDPPSEEKEEPTQMDRIEAQVFYTAMMTDTLIEV